MESRDGLNILQGPGQPSTTKDYRPNISIVLRVGNCALDYNSMQVVTMTVYCVPSVSHCSPHVSFKVNCGVNE